MENFIKELFITVNEKFDGEVKMNVVQKPNQVLTGFTFKANGTEENMACPTIYPENYYEDYVSGTELEDIADRIIELINNNIPSANFDINNITSWEWAKDRVRPIVMSKERNEKYIKTLACTDTKTDLVIAYMVEVGNGYDGLANVKITKPMLKAYGITMTELKKAAFTNAFGMYEFKNMGEVLAELMGGEPEDFEAPMYILSTEDKVLGAGVMFIPKVLTAIKKRLGVEQFYILPSSIHEVLIVRTTEGTADELRKMVTEVNATQVSAEDKLSDNVYFYNGKSIEVA